MILAEPNHKGVAACLRHLKDLIKANDMFKTIKIDLHSEYRDAIQAGSFDDPDEGYAELHRRRSYQRPMPPEKAISTIHKAKGLEIEHCLIIPCDAKSFTESHAHRCLLYVALSLRNFIQKRSQVLL